MRIRSTDGREDDVFQDDAAVPTERTRIGELLALDRQAADRVLEQQNRTGELFGEAAIDMGLVDRSAVDRAIQRQQNFTVLAHGDARVHPLVSIAFEPESELARSVRTLRGAITAFRTTNGQPLKYLGILCVDAPSEASLIAANLAVACAQAGRNTLLVDANLDLPTQNGLFAITNRSGVSTLLANAEDPSATPIPSAVAKLSVLPTGPAVPNALELFERGGLISRLQLLGERYDQVIVDASRTSQNAATICKGADAVLIVVRRDVSSQVTLRGLVETLNQGNIPVLGTVLSN
jgi:protein-tyrosine kinase